MISKIDEEISTIVLRFNKPYLLSWVNNPEGMGNVRITYRVIDGKKGDAIDINKGVEQNTIQLGSIDHLYWVHPTQVVTVKKNSRFSNRILIYG